MSNKSTVSKIYLHQSDCHSQEIEIEKRKEDKKEIIEIVKEISGLQKVELVEKIDKSLIGGFVLKVNDKLWDDSLSGKLRKARMKFAQRYFVKLY